jgi:histidine triad (HIT) family protein
MDCIFCKIARGEITSKIVYQDENLVAFRDISPQAPTHILIIPVRHFTTIKELSPQDRELVGDMVLLANKLAAAEDLAEDGYRLVLNCGHHGGQTAYHIHLHLLGGRQMHWPPG